MNLWTWLFGTPPADPPPPSPAGQQDDRPPDRRVLYNVQHRILPEMVLRVRDQRLGDVFAAGTLGTYARYLWAKSTHEAMLAGVLQHSFSPPLNPTPPGDPAGDLFQTGIDLLVAVTVHAQRRDDRMAQVFVMPPPAYPLEAHFVGVVYQGEWPTAEARYFTLERTYSADPQLAFLCEWTANGRHVNLTHPMAPDRELFAAEVLARCG